MKIKELREYLNALPEQLDNFEVEYVEAVRLQDDKWARKDIHIESIIIDEDTEELLLGTPETINNIVKWSK